MWPPPGVGMGGHGEGPSSLQVNRGLRLLYKSRPANETSVRRDPWRGETGRAMCITCW